MPNRCHADSRRRSVAETRHGRLGSAPAALMQSNERQRGSVDQLHRWVPRIRCRAHERVDAVLPGKSLDLVQKQRPARCFLENSNAIGVRAVTHASRGPNSAAPLSASSNTPTGSQAKSREASGPLWWMYRASSLHPHPVHRRSESASRSVRDPNGGKNRLHRGRGADPVAETCRHPAHQPSRRSIRLRP